MENVTYTQSISAASRLVTYGCPIIVMFGLVGNGLSLITVTTRFCKKSSFTVYIGALSIVDTTALIAISGRVWPEYALGVDVDSGVIFCKLFPLLGYISGTSSTWLVTVMTSERFMVTYFPLKAKDWFGTTFGYIVVVINLAVTSGLYVHILYGTAMETTQNGTVIAQCDFVDAEYEAFFLMIFPWFDFVAYFLLPFLTILFCNTAIMIKFLAFKRIHPVTTMNQMSTIGLGQHRRKLNRQMLIIALLLSTCFLVCVSPLVVYSAIRVYVMDVNGYALANSTDELLFCVFGIFTLMSHSLNFYIYVLVGKGFRYNLRKALRLRV